MPHVWGHIGARTDRCTWARCLSAAEGRHPRCWRAASLSILCMLSVILRCHPGRAAIAAPPFQGETIGCTCHMEDGRTGSREAMVVLRSSIRLPEFVVFCGGETLHGRVEGGSARPSSGRAFVLGAAADVPVACPLSGGSRCGCSCGRGAVVRLVSLGLFFHFTSASAGSGAGACARAFAVTASRMRSTRAAAARRLLGCAGAAAALAGPW